MTMGSDGAQAAPAVLPGLDEAVGEAHQPGGREHHPGRVEPRLLGGLALRDQGQHGEPGPSRATGTFIRNTQPHQAWLRM